MNGPPHRPARHLPRGTPSQPVLPRVPTQAVHRPLDWELGYCRAGKYGDLLIWISLLATLSIRIRVRRMDRMYNGNEHVVSAEGEQLSVR